MRRPVVGVMGGADVDPKTAAVAHALGRAIAQRGWVLLNGGRPDGVMGASAAGAKEGGGTVVGVLPGTRTDPASDDIDVAIFTGMGSARNMINVLSSDAIVVLPGAGGTLSEAALARAHAVPTLLLGYDDRGLLPEARSVHDVEETMAVLDDLLGVSQR